MIHPEFSSCVSCHQSSRSRGGARACNHRISARYSIWFLSSSYDVISSKQKKNQYISCSAWRLHLQKLQDSFWVASRSFWFFVSMVPYLQAWKSLLYLRVFLCLFWILCGSVSTSINPENHMVPLSRKGSTFSSSVTVCLGWFKDFVRCAKLSRFRAHI